MSQNLRSARLFLHWAAVLACTFATALQAAPSRQWTIVDVGALGSRGSIPMAINNRGEVVGYSAAPVPGQPYEAYHPFVWSNGTMMDLGLDIGRPPGSAYAEATAINEKGTIVGDGNGTIHIWKDGERTELAFQARAEDVNKSGAFVGTYNGHGYLYNDGVLTDLGTLPGGVSSNATAINDKGVVVGTSGLAGNNGYRAFSWKDGVMTNLGTLGGDSGAVDINNHGVILGAYVDMTTFKWKTFISDSRGMRPLFDGPVPEGNQYAAAINDKGAVAGNIENIAFVYEHGKFTALNTLPEVRAAGWATLFVMDMNDRGWITGSGWRYDDPYGNGHGFVLIPK
jgi:probable HAF family extracellular repeat protein